MKLLFFFVVCEDQRGVVFSCTTGSKCLTESSLQVRKWYTCASLAVSLGWGG